VIDAELKEAAEALEEVREHDPETFEDIARLLAAGRSLLAQGRRAEMVALLEQFEREFGVEGPAVRQ
jgi:hypothetical protein